LRISFYGAADGVTGSRHLVDIEGLRLLLDCGMFQGYKLWRERNWQPFPVPPASIDAVLLSHAHLDHSGWLPCLVKQGFKGPIYCSPATRDLTELLLLDAAHLQEEDARHANRGGWSRHQPALPLYTTRDAQRAIAQLTPVTGTRALKLNAQVQASFIPAGHLLGACSIALRSATESMLYSGDLGRNDDLLMPPPSQVPGARTVLVESTYGNRLHPTDNMQQRLGEIIRRTIHRGGKVLLPTFAVGRAQALMLVLQRLRAAGDIPEDLPIYLDSPMAQEATEIYLRHRKLLRLNASEARSLCDGVTAVVTPKQSQALVAQRWPAVILSASGMATGGRVLHHLSALAPQPRNAVVFPGFQVPGSRGAKLVGGAPDVKIFGRYVAVKAEVHHLEGFSGHADRIGLLAWLRSLPQAPEHTYVVHGDAEAADILRTHIADALGWTAQVPAHGSSVEIQRAP